MVKQIPNALSILRIPVSIAMPLLAGLENLIPFFVCFVVAGLTDVFDGIIARKLGVTSDFGEKIDSLGDGIFILCLITSALVSMDLYLLPYHWGIGIALLTIRAMNMLFTWSKFRRIGFIHTRSTRWTGILLYVLVPISIFLGNIPPIPVAVALVLLSIAQLEETYILGKMEPEEYTMSLKSYWEWQRDKRRAAAADVEQPQQDEVLA